MLNRGKLHLNRFGMIQLVKNYCEILRTWHHIEKPANEGIPILKPFGLSSPCKTTKNSKISDNRLNTVQKNPIDSIRQLKLSNPHKIILGHLILTPFEANLSQLQMLFREHLAFFFYQKLKLTKASLINSLA